MFEISNPYISIFILFRTNVGGEITILTDHDLKYLSCEAHGDHVEAHLQVQLKVITCE